MVFQHPFHIERFHNNAMKRLRYDGGYLMQIVLPDVGYPDMGNSQFLSGLPVVATSLSFT